MARQTAHAEYEPLLRDTSSSVLSERENWVQELTQHPGWRVLNELWDQMDSRLVDAVMERGGLPTHEEYIQAHSKVKGLRLARLAPHALGVAAERARSQAEEHA